MSTTTAPNPAKILIGLVRFSYCFLNEPRPSDEPEKKPKYEASIIIQKSDAKSIAAVEKAIEAAKERGKSEYWDGKVPKDLKISWYDGDDKEDSDPAYAKGMYLSARSTRQPQVVDRNKNLIIDKDEIYSGMYGYVTLEAYPYKHPKGGKGIAFSLGNILKYKDGERLAGGSTADQDFADLQLAEDADELM